MTMKYSRMATSITMLAAIAIGACSSNQNGADGAKSSGGDLGSGGNPSEPGAAKAPSKGSQAPVAKHDDPSDAGPDSGPYPACALALEGAPVLHCSVTSYPQDLNGFCLPTVVTQQDNTSLKWTMQQDVEGSPDQYYFTYESFSINVGGVEYDFSNPNNEDGTCELFGGQLKSPSPGLAGQANWQATYKDGALHYSLQANWRNLANCPGSGGARWVANCTSD